MGSQSQQGFRPTKDFVPVIAAVQIHMPSTTASYIAQLFKERLIMQGIGLHDQVSGSDQSSHEFYNKYQILEHSSRVSAAS